MIDDVFGLDCVESLASGIVAGDIRAETHAGVKTFVCKEGS